MKSKSSNEIRIKRLTQKDLPLMRELNQVFAIAFDDPKSYRPKPSTPYIKAALSKKHVIVLAALHEKKVVGGIVAYVLEKLEQERSEVYLYDLAVAADHRRKGIARALIEHLKVVAKKSGAWVIFVQADRPDVPAIQLYESMGNEKSLCTSIFRSIQSILGNRGHPCKKVSRFGRLLSPSPVVNFCNQVIHLSQANHFKYIMLRIMK